MIYMEPLQLGWSPLRDSYMNTLPKNLSKEHREVVRLQIFVFLLAHHTCFDFIDVYHIYFDILSHR